MKRIVIVLLLTLGVSAARASVEEDFRAAISLYDQGKFSESAQSLQQIIDRGYASPQLYYNAGCAYYKSGRLGHAIANFRRAQRLAPEDEDIKANLQFAQLFTVDKIEASDKALFQSQIGSVLNTLSPNQYFLISLLAFGGLFLLLTLKRTGKLQRSPTGWLITLGVVTAICVGAMIWTLKSNYLVEEGVVVVEQTDVLSGPGTDFEVQFEAHEGLLFQILDSRADYYLGLFANQLKGWVRRSDVLTI
ncbi:MAG: tetratricopeptide repeat protein [candidate division Zixibacteria bacterium]|nr:tetratricopeptide repeat protein [candidate division Zixibacteria bacterium]